MRVVRPDDCLGVGAARLEQMLKGLEHVCVAQVPRLWAAIIHDAKIAFGGRDQTRVLCRVEKIVVALHGVAEPPLQQVLTLLDHRLFARSVAGGQHGAAIGRRLLLPRREAAIALARDRRRIGINLIKIGEHSGDGATHIVEVEPVKAGATIEVTYAVIMVAHPIHQRSRFSVAPHPCGKTLKRGLGLSDRGAISHIAVDGRCIRPIRFDGEDREPVLGDQMTGDGGASLIEFRRAVARFPEQHHSAIGEALKQAPERRIVERGQRFSSLRNHLRQALSARLAWHVVGRGTTTILGPALLADQRHESHGTKVLLIIVSFAPADNLEQALMPPLIAHRNDEAAADGQLIFEGLRNAGPSGRHQDRIERRRFGPAARAIANRMVTLSLSYPSLRKRWPAASASAA